MFTYQVRPRIFRAQGQAPPFPVECEIRVHFHPLQPFGLEAGQGRTTVRAVAARSTFNANNGQHSIESHQPLSPLNALINDGAGVAHFEGNTFRLVRSFPNGRELASTVEGLYFGLPILLNLGFADPPYVERIDGRIGTVAFRWELAEWHASFHTTTQAEQEAHAGTAWVRMGILAHPDRRRLIAALHYFHAACRLDRASATIGEFLPEVVLNLSKTLEVLFPPTDGDGKTRDAVRQGLRAVGLTNDQIERDFIPAMALRNEIDVGHVELGLFKPAELTVIHSFIERAEGAFRDMLGRVMASVEAGTFEIRPYTVGPARRDAKAVIERMREMEQDRSDNRTE